MRHKVKSTLFLLLLLLSLLGLPMFLPSAKASSMIETLNVGLKFKFRQPSNPPVESDIRQDCVLTEYIQVMSV